MNNLVLTLLVAAAVGLTILIRRGLGKHRLGAARGLAARQSAAENVEGDRLACLAAEMSLNPDLASRDPEPVAAAQAAAAPVAAAALDPRRFAQLSNFDPDVPSR